MPLSMSYNLQGYATHTHDTCINLIKKKLFQVVNIRETESLTFPPSDTFIGQIIFNGDMSIMLSPREFVQ